MDKYMMILMALVLTLIVIALLFLVPVMIMEIVNV